MYKLKPLPESIVEMIQKDKMREFLYPDGDKKPYCDAVIRYLKFYQYCTNEGYDTRQFKLNLEYLLNSDTTGKVQK